MDSSSIAGRWGIEILGVQLLPANSMLDFRFRIIDPAKALSIVDPNFRPYMIDQASGAKFMAPSPPKVGQLHHPMRRVGKPKANQTYSILFTHTGRPLQSGSKVTVVIGSFRASDLVLQ
jgi:hypothetical protein